MWRRYAVDDKSYLEQQGAEHEESVDHSLPSFEQLGDRSSREMSLDEFLSGGVRSGDDATFEPAADGGQEPAADGGGVSAPGTIRDYVSQTLGYALPADVGDDQAALVHLIREAQGADQLRAQARQQELYAQLGQAVAPRAAELVPLLAQPQQPTRKPWEPPPFDRRWAQLVEPAGNGLYVGRPGTPQDIVDKVNAFAQWAQDFHGNPGKALQAFGDDMRAQLREEFTQEWRESEAAQQLQAQVHKIAQANTPWAYARDPQGGLTPDPINGGYALSPLGQQYVGLVKALGDQGVASPIARDQIARAMLAGPIQQALAAGTPAPSAGGQRSGRNPSLRQALGQMEREAEEQQVRRDGHERAGALRDKLRRAFQEAGVTDSDLMGNGAFTAGAR
jgi:hypothetical protein